MKRLRELWTNFNLCFVPFLYKNPKPWPEFLPWFQICFILLTSLISYKIEYLQIFTLIGEHSQGVFLDNLPRKEAVHCRLVTLDSKDYEDYSDNTCVSPGLLKAIIGKILLCHPAVLVVDFDTSAHHFDQSTFQIPPQTEIVWGRDAYEQPKTGLLLPGRVAGTVDPPKELLFGYALFPRNPNWAIRKFNREIEIDGKTQPTLFWAAVQQYRAHVCRVEPAKCEIKGEVHPKEEEVAIADLQYRFKEVPVSDLLSRDEAASGKLKLDSGTYDMENRIVLLGGKYSSSDRHHLGSGEANGVEIVAAAIESELSGQNRKQVDELLVAIIEVLLGFLILAIHRSFRPLPAVVMMFALSGLVFVATFALLYAGRVVNFVPFFLAIWIEQLIEGTVESAKEDLPSRRHAHSPEQG